MPALDLPPGWSSQWDGSQYIYLRAYDGFTMQIRPFIAGTWISACADWIPGVEPTAHWVPSTSSLTAAASWLEASPEDYAFAAAAATLVERANYQVFHGQTPVWLRPPSSFPPGVIAAVLDLVAAQTEANHPGSHVDTRLRWAREAHTYRTRRMW